MVIKKRSDQRLLDKFDDEDASEGDQAKAFEQLSFTVCNKDGTDGLTWDEIKACKVIFTFIKNSMVSCIQHIYR